MRTFGHDDSTPQTRRGGWRTAAGATLILLSAVLGIGLSKADADVSAVTGSAYGFSANIILFQQQQTPVEPTPTVTLPPGGSASPVTASVATASVIFGPARIFTSGPVTASTQGTPGPTGSVTSSVDIETVNTSGQEAFTADEVTSTCTASDAGVTGSTTIASGTLQTSEEGGPGGTPTIVDIPTNPAPNTAIDGVIEGVGGERFRYIFNEQIMNADGSLTINAVHEVLMGPLAVGDLIVGQSVCGATVVPASTTTTTAGPGTTTTTTDPTGTSSSTSSSSTSSSSTSSSSTSSSSTSSTTSTTTPGNGSGIVGGGAFGYFTDVGLFGGPKEPRGPSPTVTLPATGSETPITDTAPTGDARYGPGIIFTSGPITVSTQGTPGPTGSVTSSTDIATLNTSDQEVINATRVTSTCTASETEATGSTTIEGGRLRTSAGDPNVEGDETFATIPANPAPNTTIEGVLEDVGDTFRYIFNEQIVEDGSIIVNAARQILLGPTAVGEVIIGQSRCAFGAAVEPPGDEDPPATDPPGGTTPPGVQGSTRADGSTAGQSSSPRGGLARTGSASGALIGVGILLLASGWLATRHSRGARRGSQRGR